MSNDDKIKELGREEIAKKEVGHTDMPRWLSITMVLVFLVVIVLVPLIQTAVELSRGERPQALSIFGAAPRAAAQKTDSTQSGFRRLIARNARLLDLMGEYEDTLEDESLLRGLLLGPAQTLLARALGAGNEKAYIGHDGWLFYRPDVDYVTNAGFLDRRILTERQLAQIQPDPRKAIEEFAEQLKARDIQLVIVPTPVKPMMHPDKLSGRYDTSGALPQNPSYARFISDIKKGGILVFDPSTVLRDMRNQRRDCFLPADTHWNPDGMDAVAAALAAFLQKHCEIKAGRDGAYQRAAVPIENIGDIAGMLMLPSGQTLYPPKRYEISQVISSRGTIWSPQVNSEILLLGDSFSNIFSLEMMRWGTAAGFAEQISYHLQQSIDTICQNDSGAFATRQRLSHQLRRGVDRLAGKKVVIWQFAMRELAFGDWKSIPMDLGEPRPSTFLSVKPGSRQVVSGEVVARAPSPHPSKVTYENHIIAVHLTSVRSDDGTITNRQVLGYVMGMKGRKLTPAAAWRPGDQVRIALQSWEDHQKIYSRVNRNELEDEMLMLEDPVWLTLDVEQSNQ